MFMRITALIAAAGLTTAPVAAQSSAAPLSVQPALAERASADAGESRLATRGSWFPPLVAAAIVIGGILLATGIIFDDDDPDSP